MEIYRKLLQSYATCWYNLVKFRILLSLCFNLTDIVPAYALKFETL